MRSGLCAAVGGSRCVWVLTFLNTPGWELRVAFGALRCGWGFALRLGLCAAFLRSCGWVGGGGAFRSPSAVVLRRSCCLSVRFLMCLFAGWVVAAVRSVVSRRYVFGRGGAPCCFYDVFLGGWVGGGWRQAACVFCRVPAAISEQRSRRSTPLAASFLLPFSERWWRWRAVLLYVALLLPSDCVSVAFPLHSL